MSSPTTTILKLNNPSRPSKNLFCFHWVGGNANAFRPIAKGLEKDNVVVYAMNLPGRGGATAARDIIRTTIEVVDILTRDFVNNVGLWKLNEYPTFFFGHSFGGLIAFELQRRIQAMQPQPWRLVHLILSAVKNPLTLTEFNKNPASELKHKQTEDWMFNYIVSIGGMTDFIALYTSWLI